MERHGSRMKAPTDRVRIWDKDFLNMEDKEETSLDVRERILVNFLLAFFFIHSSLV